MSTEYYVTSPLTLAEVKKITGWEEVKTDEGQACLSDGDDFLWASVLVLGGKKYLSFTRFNLNDPDDFIQKLEDAGLEVVSEHDDDPFLASLNEEEA